MSFLLVLGLMHLMLMMRTLFQDLQWVMMICGKNSVRECKSWCKNSMHFIYACAMNIYDMFFCRMTGGLVDLLLQIQQGRLIHQFHTILEEWIIHPCSVLNHQLMEIHNPWHVNQKIWKLFCYLIDKLYRYQVI